MAWSRRKCEWIDKWTYYRSWAEISSVYKHYFDCVENIEADYFQLRLGLANSGVRLPAFFRKWLINKLGGRVFIASNSR
jgi:hypothetical protein